MAALNFASVGIASLLITGVIIAVYNTVKENNRKD